MADGISMPWFGQPADMQAPARAIGTIAGGALRAARPSVRQGRSYLETLPGAMEEASGLQQDPQFLLKRSVLQKQIINIGVQYETQLLKNQLEARQMAADADDQMAIAKGVSENQANPEALLQWSQTYVPRSARGQQALTNIRMGVTQSMQRQVGIKMNSQFIEAVGKLQDPTQISALMADAYDAIGLVKPDKMAAAISASNQTEREKTFAPTQAEKLLKAYRTALDDGDDEAANFFKSRMTTADDEFKTSMRRDVEQRYLRKQSELAGLRAAVSELERNPRSKSMISEEGQLLARRKSALAAAEQEFKTLENQRTSFLQPEPAAPAPVAAPVNKDPLGLLQ